VKSAYSFRRALTSSHIFRRSAPLGAFPLAPLPFPDSVSRVASSSCFTSLTSAACHSRHQYMLKRCRDTHSAYLVCPRRLDFQRRLQHALACHHTRWMTNPRHFQAIRLVLHGNREETLQDIVNGEVGRSADKESQRTRVGSRLSCQLTDDLDQGMRFASPCEGWTLIW